MTEDTFEVLGVRVDPVTTPEVIDQVRRAVEQRRTLTLMFCTVSSVLSARADPSVRRAFDEAGVVCPDGMPLVWLGKREGRDIERVYGPDFMIDLIAATGSELGHFFYGGGAGVAEEMAARLRKRFPQLRVAGTHAPGYGVDPSDPDPEDLDLINSAKPDVLWVGLGHPKQDVWIHLNQERLSAPVLAAVGAAFDFHAGRIPEAPSWMKTSGLQWFHRLMSDPKRLWRRYLVGNTQFLLLLLGDLFKRRLARLRH